MEQTSRGKKFDKGLPHAALHIAPCSAASDDIGVNDCAMGKSRVTSV